MFKKKTVKEPLDGETPAKVEPKKKNGDPLPGTPRLDVWEVRPGGPWAGRVEVYQVHWWEANNPAIERSTREELLAELMVEAEQHATALSERLHQEATRVYIDVESPVERGQKKVV